MAAFLFSKLMDGDGPLTATGKTKRAFAHYLAVVGTQSKIASALGLPKPAATPQGRGSVLPPMSQYVAPDAGDDA